jgi:hypothetical protein
MKSVVYHVDMNKKSVSLLRQASSPSPGGGPRRDTPTVRQVSAWGDVSDVRERAKRMKPKPSLLHITPGPPHHCAPAQNHEYRTAAFAQPDL